MFPGHSLAAVVPVQTQSHKTDILRASPPFLLSICSPHSYTPPSFPLFFSHQLLSSALHSPPSLLLFSPTFSLSSSPPPSFFFSPLTSFDLPSHTCSFLPRCSVCPPLLFLFIYCHHFFFSHFASSSLFLTFHILLTKLSMSSVTPPPVSFPRISFCNS